MHLNLFKDSIKRLQMPFAKLINDDSIENLIVAKHMLKIHRP